MRACILVLLVLVMAVTRETSKSVPAYVATPRYPRPGGDEHPVRLIFDTDVGNDIDDALALGVIHALQDRGECQLLAVTITKDDNYSAPFVDLVNTFYGRSGIPVGVVKHGKTPEDGRYTRIVCQARDNGDYRYPRHLASNKEATDAVSLMRRSLACQPDRSVVFVVTGFSTNLARLLESSSDEHSAMAGQALVARKCRLLSIMAGMYSLNNNHKEYNVVTDLPSARRVFAEWPTPIVASGFEIGLTIQFPAVAVERDFRYVRHHPLREAYSAFMEMPYDRPAWDLTSVLYAVRPDRGFFGLSEAGTIQIDEEGTTRLVPSPGGTHHYLTVDEHQVTRACEALVQLASQPPNATRQLTAHRG
jgi:inosine-uridine nucleoside N-ribohydrolase